MDKQTADLALAVIAAARSYAHTPSVTGKLVTLTDSVKALNAHLSVQVGTDEIAEEDATGGDREGTFADLQVGDSIRGKNGQWAEIAGMERGETGATLRLTLGTKTIALTKDWDTPVTFRRGAEARAIEILTAAFGPVEVLSMEGTP